MRCSTARHKRISLFPPTDRGAAHTRRRRTLSHVSLALSNGLSNGKFSVPPHSRHRYSGHEGPTAWVGGTNKAICRRTVKRRRGSSPLGHTAAAAVGWARSAVAEPSASVPGLYASWILG